VERRAEYLADLEDFVRDHRSHGSLTADATPPAWNGHLLTVACPCGDVLALQATLQLAAATVLLEEGVEIGEDGHAPSLSHWQSARRFGRDAWALAPSGMR
jgi:hypothetical protein